MSEPLVLAPPSIVFKLPGFIHRDVAIVLAGAMANWILFGILWVQVYLYYVASNLAPNLKKGHIFLKLTVFVELALETVQTIAVTHDVFKFFTVGFTDPAVINQVGTAWYSVPLMTGLIACFAQAFYCYRAWVFTKSKYCVALIAMFSVCEFGAAITVAVQTKRATLLTKVLGTEVSLIAIGIWGASGLLCDVMIAWIMTYYLKKWDTGFKNTHDLINRLIRLCIETGSITASLAGISLALVYLPQHPPYYQVAGLILAKTYSNSMIAALNSRVKVLPNVCTVGIATTTTGRPVWNEEVDVDDMNSRGLEFNSVGETESGSAHTV